MQDQPERASSRRCRRSGNLVRYEHPLMVTGLAPFRRSIGLDTSATRRDATGTGRSE